MTHLLKNSQFSTKNAKKPKKTTHFQSKNPKIQPLGANKNNHILARR